MQLACTLVLGVGHAVRMIRDPTWAYLADKEEELLPADYDPGIVFEPRPAPEP